MGISDGGGSLSEGLFRYVWAALDGDPEIAQAVSFSGGQALPGCFGYTDMVAATLAGASAAISELLAAGGHAPRPVHVDRVLASGWVLNLTRPVAPRARLKWPFTVNGEYPTADGRYLRLTATHKHLQARTMAVLGCAETPEAVAAEILRHDADDIEQAIVDGGSVAAASRSIAEWAEHPHGGAVRTEPLIAVNERGGIEDRWRPTPGRPLAGIRVLDFTRVIAGPMATRWLAGFGAEVLRIDAPDFDEWIMEPGPIGLTIGKRCARLDMRTAEGREHFLRLLSEADVFVHGLRPGAFDSLGVGDEVRARANPNIVEVQHNAYGWTGPWAGRRGFDSIVCYSSGVWQETLRQAGFDKPSHETLHLIQPILLDHCAGYLDAAAAVRGLTRRLKEGKGSLSRLSLARMLWMMIDAGQPKPEPEIVLPVDGPYEDRVYVNPDGPVRRLKFPAPVADNPFFWERPGDTYGSSTPEWVTSRQVGRVSEIALEDAVFDSLVSVR